MELAVHSDEVIRIGKILGRDVGKYQENCLFPQVAPDLPLSCLNYSILKERHCLIHMIWGMVCL